MTRVNNLFIIAADTGNGNVKTVSTCTPTSVSVFATKPMKLYICGGGARVMKKFCPTLAKDERVFLMTDICAAAKGYEPMTEKILRDAYGQ